MKHRDQILVSSDFVKDWIDGNPWFVFMTDNDAYDFLVKLNKFVAVWASHHSYGDNFLDLLFFFLIDFKLFGFPVSLDCVLKLDESCLLDGLINVGIIDDFHESHAVALIKESEYLEFCWLQRDRRWLPWACLDRPEMSWEGQLGWVISFVDGFTWEFSTNKFDNWGSVII